MQIHAICATLHKNQSTYVCMYVRMYSGQLHSEDAEWRDLSGRAKKVFEQLRHTYMHIHICIQYMMRV